MEFDGRIRLRRAVFYLTDNLATAAQKCLRNILHYTVYDSCVRRETEHLTWETYRCVCMQICICVSFKNSRWTVSYIFSITLNIEIIIIIIIISLQNHLISIFPHLCNQEQTRRNPAVDIEQSAVFYRLQSQTTCKWSQNVLRLVSAD